MGNLDFNLLRLQRAGIILLGLESLAFAKRREGFDRIAHRVKLVSVP